jgi:hypothetical protein
MYVKNDNNNKVQLIIFTYKRAILLEEVLNSIFKNFVNKALPIYVIYHKDKAHVKSYDLLKKKWKKKGVIFYERKKINYLKLTLLVILRPLNFLWLVRWPDLLKNFNNFKFLLENIIKKSKYQFITMVTDDQIFFKKTAVSQKIFQELIKNKNSFYRFFTGDHFKDEHKIPLNLKIIKFYKEKIKFFSWKTNDKFANASWKYRFTIDGTIYVKSELLNLISPMVYHNPITLEAIGLWESRFRNFFQLGYSAKNRTSAHYQINNVQKLVINQCSNFDPNLLMKAYLKGFKLIVGCHEFIRSRFNIVPKNIKLLKKGKIYKIEDKII